ncbi:MAG: ABC transporter ATP-binding protein [Acutalibacteraceae bacterium]|nr:ABC transporter ATP-binding protein [Eubacteriales bacterium]MEE1188052.1 ABC transporter ATP-binding protein [Acutalibacteraceae bacterium]MEE3311758.1 ABC transporter ATP-binding protein [Acutalibacteraceae bacterium]
MAMTKKIKTVRAVTARTSPQKESLLSMKDLRVSYGDYEALHGYSLELAPGEIHCIAGESGSGKSTILKALLGLTSYSAEVTGGSMTFAGEDVLAMSDKARRELLGDEIGLIAQNPAASFNPLRTFRRQFEETLESHGKKLDEHEVFHVFKTLGLPTDGRVLSSCPYEVSGGMCQRVAIALLMLLKPRLLLCDEVTSALDVTTQKQVADELLRLRDETGMAILLVTHNLGLAAYMADTISILLNGDCVESGPVGGHYRDGAPGVLATPSHDYTKKLLHDVADFEDDLRPRTAFETSDPTAVELSDVHKTYRVRGNDVQALKGVDLKLYQGEILGVVGESGSGKSTILRQICGMETPEVGDVHLDGKYQYIFQDAYASFDPRMTIRQSLYESIRNAAKRDGKPSQRGNRVPEYDERIRTYLEQVGLSEELLDRFPSRLSGGQCQRMAIARALVADPEVLLCDEITSALDVTAQREVVELLVRLQKELGLSIIFVSHDLALVHSFCDRILVLKSGEVVTCGDAATVIQNTEEPYTKQLLDSVLTVR